MGNQVGKGANRMAIAAMSNVTHLERREMSALLQKFREIAAREGNPLMINRSGFAEAMSIIGVNQNDIEILDRLFTMYDKTGDDYIGFREFMAGIAPLISGSHTDKIDFGFKLYDMDGTGILRASELMNVLSNMNRVASYFGDPVMSEDQIHSVIMDVLELAGGSPEGLSAQLHVADYLTTIADHPMVNTFINGGGGVQYGMGR
jgi:Ca2+-binding EF-hand superfamily protein